MKIKGLIKSAMATAVSSAFMLQPILFHASAIEKMQMLMKRIY